MYSESLLELEIFMKCVIFEALWRLREKNLLSLLKQETLRSSNISKSSMKQKKSYKCI